ncbi:MAG: hypothetical protein NTY07_10345 [Bacteroidia bacterium]|nr:hypothetical protein [Bacteroidia bacterium]
MSSKPPIHEKINLFFNGLMELTPIKSGFVSSVITSVIDEMKRTLDGKVKEVEEQISL